MKRKLWICFVLVCLISLFALPAMAAYTSPVAGTTVKAGSAADLAELFALIKNEAQGVLEADASKRMETVNIEITGDIHLPVDGLHLSMGSQVNMYSTPGQTYTITMEPPRGLFGDQPMIWMEGASVLQVSNMVFDGLNNHSGGFWVGGSELILNNVVLENFQPEIPMLASMVSGTDANIFVGPNRDRYRFAPVVRMNNCTVRNNANAIQRPLFFLYSSMDAGLYIKDSTFTNNTALGEGAYFGGAIWVQGFKLDISGSTFTGNKSSGGGAVCAVKSDVTITNCLFQNNETLQYNIDGNTGGDGGGALYLQNNTSATIANTRFINNKSSISGGAVTLFINTEATFTDCTFTGNEAVTHGGAICVADSFDADAKLSKGIFNNCTFTGNKAQGHDGVDEFSSSPEAAGGGAIFLHEYCEAYLNEGTVLQNNQSADEGGAVFVSFGGKLFMDGAIIDGNKAATDGGAVYLDGTGAYNGYSHANDGNIPGDDDGYGAGGEFTLKDGAITNNEAGRNGGGVYIGGNNEVVVDGDLKIYTGGKLNMTGGIITLNTALDMGGGVYVGASENTGIGGILNMTGGAICLNVAGENGNTSDGADDAGADVYSEGTRAFITVVTADKITEYIQNPANKFVPDSIRGYRFTNWYDDYSDQDPTYGKMAGTTGINPNTGRYKSSVDPHRVVYTPLTQDAAYNALILDLDDKVVPEVPVTGDAAAPFLWLGLSILSAAAAMLLLKRKAA